MRARRGFSRRASKSSRQRAWSSRTWQREPSWPELYVQAQAKFELPARPEKADRAFVYNLYVGRDTSIQPTTWTLGVELNGENRELALTPQVRKGLTKTGALGASIGVQIPLNDRRERSHARRRLPAVGIPRARPSPTMNHTPIVFALLLFGTVGVTAQATGTITGVVTTKSPAHLLRA